VGQLGSRVRVSASFQKNFPPHWTFTVRPRLVGRLGSEVRVRAVFKFSLRGRGGVGVMSCGIFPGIMTWISFHTVFESITSEIKSCQEVIKFNERRPN